MHVVGVVGRDVVNRILQILVGVVDRFRGQRGERPLDSVAIAAMHHFDQELARLGAGGRIERLDRVQRFVLMAAPDLHLRGVPEEHFQHRQCLLRLRQFFRHIVGRRQGHEGVVTNVVFTGERANVG